MTEVATTTIPAVGHALVNGRNIIVSVPNEGQLSVLAMQFRALKRATRDSDGATLINAMGVVMDVIGSLMSAEDLDWLTDQMALGLVDDEQIRAMLTGLFEGAEGEDAVAAKPARVTKPARK